MVPQILFAPSSALFGPLLADAHERIDVSVDFRAERFGYASEVLLASAEQTPADSKAIIQTAQG